MSIADEIHAHNLVRWLLTLFLLNAADGFFTTIWLVNGLATEANPFLRLVWETGGPIAFALFKFGLVLFFSCVLFQKRAHRLARAGVKFLTGVYAVILFYHLSNVHVLF